MFHRIVFLVLIFCQDLLSLCRLSVVFSRTWTSQAEVIKMPRVSNGFNTESTRTLSNFDFQWTKTLYQNNLKHIAFFLTFFKALRRNKSSVVTPKKISHGSPRKWMSNFTKSHLQNLTCVITILVKFDIHFPGPPWEILFCVTTDDLLHL